MQHITPPAGCGIIYMYAFDNGKRYIGQTVDPVGRFNCHRTRVENLRTPVECAMHKHDYIYSVLEVLPVSELDAEEIRLIKELNTLVPNGYNISLGGTNGNRGGGSALAKEIVVFNAQTGEFLGKYPSARDAADAFNTTRNVVVGCCFRKGYNRAHTLIFRLAEEYPGEVLPEGEIYTGRSQEWTDKITASRMANFTEASRRKLRESHLGQKRTPEAIRKTVETKRANGIRFGAKPRPVDVYDAKSGELLGHFESAREAATYCGVTHKAVYNNLFGWSNTTRRGKYICKFGDE